MLNAYSAQISKFSVSPTDCWWGRPARWPSRGKRPTEPEACIAATSRPGGRARELSLITTVCSSALAQSYLVHSTCIPLALSKRKERGEKAFIPGEKASPNRMAFDCFLLALRTFTFLSRFACRVLLSPQPWFPNWYGVSMLPPSGVLRFYRRWLKNCSENWTCILYSAAKSSHLLLKY